MKEYRVLWFDDEFEILHLIKNKASKNGIKLFGYTNKVEGLKALDKNIHFFDAIIVDGLFYNDPDQSGDAVDDSALFSVAREIDKRTHIKALPWFILSGKDKITKEKNRCAEGFDKKVYDKINVDHLLSLWEDIKLAADQQKDTQIRHAYHSVFEVCDDKYIGTNTQASILQILKSVNEPTNTFDDKLYFTQIRIILEAMFRAANKFGFLHDKCIDGKGKVNLTESSLFLSGEKTKYLGVSCKKRHFNKLISESVKSILFITGAASHTVDANTNNNINLVEYRNSINTPYLLYSLTFQLMDVLIWFKNYVDENTDKSKNVELWEEVTCMDKRKGIVIKIAENGWGTFQTDENGSTISIIPQMVSENNLKEGQQIEVSTEPSPDGKKTFIKKIRKL